MLYRIDEGRIESPKLEFNLAFHCNLSCARCSHFSPHMKPALAALEAFRRDVHELQQVYHARRFRFVGGEPLLNKNILAFIQVIRQSSLADTIEVCTNGSLLDRVDDVFFASIDSLHVSRYPDSWRDEGIVRRVRERCRIHGTALSIENVRYFRHMNVVPALTDSLAVRVFQSCEIAHAWSCQTFLSGHFYLCSRPLVTGAYLAERGIAAERFVEVDGVPLHQPRLLERLQNYLDRTHPLASCRHCLGTVGETTEWRPLSRQEKRMPGAVDHGPPRIDRGRLGYLLATQWIIDALRRLNVPVAALHVLTLLKGIPFHWARSFSIRRHGKHLP